MTTGQLPERLPGHWETDEGLDKAREYATKARSDLHLSQHSDLALANALFLVEGHDIGIQTAAKERMRWLSVQVALLSAAKASAEAERDALRGVVEEQRWALAPFQKVAEHDIGDDEADHDLFRPMSPRYARAPVLTVGDFRRARSLSAGVGSPSESKGVEP